MSEIYLMRHGETDWNRGRRIQGRTDIPLNDTGRSQASRAADEFVGTGVSAMFASSLSRASETAAIIGARLGIAEPALTDRLVERNYGSAEGIEIGQDGAADVIGNATGVETDDEVLARAIPALREIAASIDEDARVIAVAHGALIRIVMRALTNDAFPNDQRIGNAEGFLITVSGDEIVASY